MAKKLNNNQKLWNRALKAIPTGNMFLSKNPSRFLDNCWPTYFNKSKGCEVWDLTNKRYYDFSLMGVGTNILGYANKKIDKEVEKVIKKGNLTTLKCPEEVELAENLTALHPWADMARFAKTGGEANAIAIRLARAFTGKDHIIICGYHGWHDWYLSANLDKKNNLDTHLFKDLKFKGVPSFLKKTVSTFNYNDLDSLKKIIQNNHNKVAAIKMEVQRDKKPDTSFLKSIRKIADEHKIVLIFDECTSGFRETLGGIHLKHKVNPDLAIFGKALGNGYPITSIIGKKNIMKMSEETFISSTFWSERIGIVAAIKTLKEMKRVKSWKTISENGRLLKKEIAKIAKKNDFEISFKGLDSLISFEIQSQNTELLHKFISYEMLKVGFLAKNSIYVSTAHTKKIIKKYLFNLDLVFKKMKAKTFSEIKREIKKNL